MKRIKKGILCLVLLLFSCTIASCVLFDELTSTSSLSESSSSGKVSSESHRPERPSSEDSNSESDSEEKSPSDDNNTGDDNTGNDNTGDDNTGDDNTGDDNTGDDTTGDDNTGDDNTGDDNTGDDNTGDDNTGDDNTGDDNTGDDNTGDDNTGDDNTGDDNTGDDNTGDDNTGDDNTGDDNTGDDNTGNDNTGDDNTSDDNTGDDSTGDDNTGDDNTGDEPPEEELPEEEEKLPYTILTPFNDPTSSKVLIKTKFGASPLAADAIATDFGADPKGIMDSTSAIQNTLNAVSQLGGGTVFLPSGTYRISGQIVIPDYVSLVGDWNKPNADNEDENFDYGTVILARTLPLSASASLHDNALFIIGHGAGVVGITFYYTEQSATNVKNYGYTIYANAPATATFRNLTFINSTHGIGVSLNSYANELVNLENIYGTFLYNAVAHNATSDVGFYDNIHISTKYWKNATTAYKCDNAAALDTFVNDNLTAMILGDLDDQLISNVTIDGGKIGIKFTRGIRENAGFWGLVYKANITCQTGVYADFLNAVSGVAFTDSNVGIIENNSPVGCIKMCNSSYTASGTGKTIKEAGNVTIEQTRTLPAIESSTSERVFIANNLTSGGTIDNASKLQAILNSVGTEGGIVLIPNGIYRLNSTVEVPANVELRSSQSIFSRTNSAQNGKNGVVFITYVSGATFLLKDHAGIIGVRIWHAKNDFITAHNALKAGTYPNDISIKADGNGAYAYRNESVGAYVGFDFTACDNHILKSNYGISYVNFIKAGGKDGVITQCLSNPNFMTRSNLYTYFDSTLSNVANWERIKNSGESNEDFALLRDDIGRTYTKMVYLDNAENELAVNVFAYGEAGLFYMVNSTTTLINTSLDYIPSNMFVYELSGGTCDVISSLRVYGTSVKVNSGRLRAYGRIAHGESKEKAYDSDVSLEDVIEYVSENAKRTMLFNCDSISLWRPIFNVTTNKDAAYIKEGSGSWKWKTTTLESNLSSSLDLSEYKDGYLHFYLYCSDITKIGTAGQIEITSSGTCDENEYNWNLAQCVTKTGWNDVWLSFSTAGVTGGEANLSAINYMRIYTIDSSATFYIDCIEVVTD